MNHLLRKTKHDSTPQHPERATAEEFDGMNILEHMHQTKRIDRDHEDQQNAHKTETAVNHKLRQMGTWETEQITHCLAVCQTIRMIHRQYRLIIRAGKKETDISEQRDDRKGQEQHAEDHPRTAIPDKLLNSLPPVGFLHPDSSLRRTVSCNRCIFIRCSWHKIIYHLIIYHLVILCIIHQNSAQNYSKYLKMKNRNKKKCAFLQKMTLFIK